MNKVIFLLLFMSATVYSQTANSNLIIFTTYGMAKTIYATDVLNLHETKGSPYLKNSFTDGKIIDTEKNTVKDALIRYNILHGIMEVKTQANRKPVVLPKLEKIQYHIGDDKFLFSNIKTTEGEEIEGYLQELYAIDNISFLALYEAAYKASRVAVTGYEKTKPAKITIEKKYFIQKDNGNLYKLKLKERSLKEVFDDDKTVVFLKNNQIESEEDIISFLEYYTK